MVSSPWLGKEMEEFSAGVVFLEENAADGRGNHLAGWLANAAADHAQVRCFEDNADALGLKMVHDSLGQLGSKAFLDLEASGKAIDEAGEFADTDNAAGLGIGDIGERGSAEEGQQVMFAKRGKGHVLEEHHFLMGHLKGFRQNFPGGHVITRCHVGQGLENPVGSVSQPIAVGILAYVPQQGSDSTPSAVVIHPVQRTCRNLCHWSVRAHCGFSLTNRKHQASVRGSRRSPLNAGDSK
jgi:hypothetical protein